MRKTSIQNYVNEKFAVVKNTTINSSNEKSSIIQDQKMVKLIRAQGECLGIGSR